MLASDVWIEKLAILSHEDAYNSVDVAVVNNGESMTVLTHS